jgi:hypothetical protein
MQGRHHPISEKKYPGRLAMAQMEVARNRAALTKLKRGDVPYVVCDIDMPRIAEPTPYYFGRASHGFSGDVLNRVAKELGHSIAYTFENNGRLIREVTPTEAQKKKVSSQGVEPLGLHTEHPTYEHSPDYLVLIAIQASNVPTEIVLVDDVVKQVRITAEKNGRDAQEVIAVLGQSVFWNAYSPSFNTTEGLPEPERHPVLYLKEGNWNMRIRVDLVRAAPQEDRHNSLSPQGALDILQAAIATTKPTKIYFKQSHEHNRLQTQLLAFDNHRVLHGRQGKISQGGSKRRRLRRTFVHKGSGPSRVLGPTPPRALGLT